MKTTSNLISTILLIAANYSIYGQSAFTYQGRLQNSGSNVTGLYDLQFTLFNSQSGGAQIGPTVTRNSVPTSNGLFTASLDFGAGVFDGSARWLQIAVKSNGVPTFTGLGARQQITPTPEAMYAQAAGTVPAGSLTSTQLAAGAVTGPKIANGQVVRSLNFLSDVVGIVPGEGLTLNTVGNTLQIALLPPNCLTYSNCYWNLRGNGNITPGVNFLGTVAGETAPLEFRVNNTHAMRYEPSSSTPNIIGGYGGNTVAAGIIGATIAGGGQSSGANSVASDLGTISGGSGNAIAASARHSAIGGGTNNIIGDPYGCESCTVSGGSSNRMSGQYNSIGGGFGNRTQTGSFFGPAGFGTIGGGTENRVSGLSCTIGGGSDNYIGGDAFFSTIGGGTGNWASGETANMTIGGGLSNYIDSYADSATIGGGQHNRAGAFSVGATIGGGNNNTIPSFAPNATIPGGTDNAATKNAFAAGTRAQAIHQGAFVWADSTGGIASTNDNSVTMLASGGYRLFSDPAATIGAHLAIGSGSWTAMSDRNMKENFEAVSPREVLEKVASLPVQRWNYKTQDRGVRHIGPTAQDFKASFEVGESDTGISTVDGQGVALAAIQGLNQKLEEQLSAKDAEIRELRSALQIIQTQLADLKRDRADR